MKSIALCHAQIQRILLTTGLSFGLAVGGYGLAHAEVRQEINEQQISYQTGGVGQEELEELRQQASSYNTQFSFANASDRAYLNNLQVRILDADKNLIFEDADVGPLLYLQLEPGNYEIIATHENVEKKQTFSIKADSTFKEALTW